MYEIQLLKDFELADIRFTTLIIRTATVAHIMAYSITRAGEARVMYLYRAPPIGVMQVASNYVRQFVRPFETIIDEGVLP